MYTGFSTISVLGHPLGGLGTYDWWIRGNYCNEILPGVQLYKMELCHMDFMVFVPFVEVCDWKTYLLAWA